VYVPEPARGVLPQLQDELELPPSIAVVPAGQMPSPEMGANPADEMKGVYPPRPPSFAIRIGAAVRRKPFSRKEKQKWVIRGRKIKAKGNNRRSPSLV
jgi:hypothetical protein